VCRFDPAQYTVTDARQTVATMAIRWRWAAAGVDESVLATRPAVDEWSALEHANHVAATDASTFAGAVDALAARAPSVAADDLRDVAHHGGHHLTLVGRALHALGAGAPTARGSVTGLFSSHGGVPKQRVPEVTVGYRGVDGDRQASRQHHGRVWQALCLWSADVIAALRAEGHPIEPGFAGENVTIAGIDWPSLRPGVRIALGDDVVAEVSAYATPCKKNAAWFVGGDFNRMNHNREPGVSRVYASVLHDGVVREGDTVTVEPG
jgi:MOSC domain-containing protein YiiM